MVGVGSLEGLLDVHNLFTFEGEFVHHLVIALLEVVSKCKLILLLGQVRLHFSISVVDDSQEHIDEDEEHKEHVRDEKEWSQESVGVFDLTEVEITKDDTEQCEAGMMVNVLNLKAFTHKKNMIRKNKYIINMTVENKSLFY